MPGTTAWFWTERSGAMHQLKEYGKLDEEGMPRPLRRCPCCKAPLKTA